MPMAMQSSKPSQLPFWAGALVSLTCVMLVALSALHQWQSRRSDLHVAEVEMRNLAQSSTIFVNDTFDLAETLLGALVYRMEAGHLDERGIAEIREYLAQRHFNTERIRGVFVYDDAGRWLATTEHVDPAAFNNSDRAYFQHHRSSSDRTSFFGVPVRSKSGGQWILTISRRFNQPDGSFGGVVLITIDVSTFVKFFDHFDIGPNGAISLLTGEGIMLARSKDIRGDYVGRDVSGRAMFKEQHNRPPESAYHFTSPIDGLRRLSYYQRSQQYPFVIVATQAEDDVLATWWVETWMRLGTVSGLVMLVALLGAHLVGELKKRQKLAATLAAREADFRLLAEQSSDVVMRIGIDGEIKYASPSCVRVLGWPAEQLLGTSSFAGIHPNDVASVQHVVNALREGAEEEARIVYRCRHRLKNEIWIETALRATRSDATGKVDGVVAISRDITKQKSLEDELAALAAKDALTGLWNRRHFDRQLEEEWLRAKRDQCPVSLLMIDVDHFKKFNDQYGHPTGDECLRKIGKLLMSKTRRPADLAARYGGEEFAVLLPNTDAKGCARLAAELHRELELMGIPHAAHPSASIVTMSVGGATMLPFQSKAADLVAAADLALYSAKEQRNSCVMSAEVVALQRASL